MSPPKPRSDFGSVYRRGKTWHFRFRKGAADIRRGGFSSRADAQAELHRVHRELERHEMLGLRPIGEETVGAFWSQFKKRIARRRADSTAAMDETRWRGVFAPAWQDRVLREITREDVEAWIADRHCGGAPGPDGRCLRAVSPSTTNRDLAFLSVLFREAVRANLMRENPVATIERAKEQERPDQYLSPEDVARLVAAMKAGDCGEILAPYVRLLADTGLRRGELESLEWFDVDEARGSLVVRRSKNYRVRTVPLTEAAQDAINALKLHRVSGDPYVVPLSRYGLTRSKVRGRFQRAAKVAALPPSLRIHDMRHAFGSQMAAAGVPIPHLQRIMGHQAIATTMRYAKHQPDDASRIAIERLELSRSPQRRTDQEGGEESRSIGHIGGHIDD